MPDASGEAIAMLLLRWVHFLAGITWIGLLYFFNLVNVRFVPSIDAALRPQVVPPLLSRALAWFRHAAWLTVLVGLVMIYIRYWQNGDFITSNPAKTIFTGALLGVIMAVNVWVFIWPNQKKIINAMRTGATADPAWGRVALYASRANFTLSFPMLLFMGGASHFPMDWSGIILTGVFATAVGLLVWNTVQRWAPSKF